MRIVVILGSLVIASNALVFPSFTGRIRSSGGVHSIQWANLLKRANVPRIRFHDLRHLVGLMVTREAGIVVASRVLGHAGPDITARFYGHAQPHDISGALSAMTGRLQRDPS